MNRGMFAGTAQQGGELCAGRQAKLQLRSGRSDGKRLGLIKLVTVLWTSLGITEAGYAGVGNNAGVVKSKVSGKMFSRVVHVKKKKLSSLVVELSGLFVIDLNNSNVFHLQASSSHGDTFFFPSVSLHPPAVQSPPLVFADGVSRPAEANFGSHPGNPELPRKKPRQQPLQSPVGCE